MLTVSRVVDDLARSSDEESTSRNRIEMIHYEPPRSVKKQIASKHGRELIGNDLTRSDNKKQKTCEGETTALFTSGLLVSLSLSLSLWHTLLQLNLEH